MPRGRKPIFTAEQIKERRATRNKLWRADNVDKVRAYRKKWKKLNPEKVAKERRKSGIKRYGVTQQRYDEMLESQNGGCAICGSKDPKGNKMSKHFQIDHDHVTGEVRGLLCSKCNRGLGLLGDDIKQIQRAIDYLQSHKEIHAKE